MAGTSRRVRAARGHLVRLVAVTAVLAGLAVAIGLQCASGMTTVHAASAGMATDPTNDTCGHPPHAAEPAGTHQPTAQCAAPGAAGVSAVFGDDSPGPRGVGGVLVACLAFLVAVVVAIAGLRPSGLRTSMSAPRSGRVPQIRARPLRAPSLAELCLLRN